MHCRTLAAADVGPYRRLMLRAYTDDADAFTSTPQERERAPAEWWLQRIAHPEGLTVAFGAFEGEALVGTVALEFNDRSKTRHKALVVGMVVLPAWRGRGLGRQLLGLALAHARQRGGVAVVQLEVTQGNMPAEALYRGLGFAPFGVEPMATLTPGGYRTKLHLWLALEAAAAAIAEPPPEHGAVSSRPD